MRTVPITELKAHFREFINRAAAAEPIQITRRGKPVAQLTVTPPHR
jgi:prevent-host-death family protein